MSVESRLKRIEKQLRPGNGVRICPPVIITQCGRQPMPEDEQELGPAEGWITYQRQLRNQEEANAGRLRTHPASLGSAIVIDLDVAEEYRERREESR